MSVNAGLPLSRNVRQRRSSSWFSFPNPVNEVSARLVAGGVVVLSALAIALNQPWLIAVIAYGFVARVLAGPKLSPLAQLVTRVTPRLGLTPRPVPGPPKRFRGRLGACARLAPDPRPAHPRTPS
jgi:Domain of unknown function (DUF4395)